MLGHMTCFSLDVLLSLIYLTVSYTNAYSTSSIFCGNTSTSEFSLKMKYNTSCDWSHFFVFAFKGERWNSDIKRTAIWSFHSESTPNNYNNNKDFINVSIDLVYKITNYLGTPKCHQTINFTSFTTSYKAHFPSHSSITSPIDMHCHEFNVNKY
jgi:hypothetical protein